MGAKRGYEADVEDTRDIYVPRWLNMDIELATRRINLRGLLLVAVFVYLYCGVAECEAEFCYMYRGHHPYVKCVDYFMKENRKQWEMDTLRKTGSLIRTQMRMGVRYRRKLEKQRERMGKTGELDVG